VRTEALLTSRDGFGISTATPVQRAACRIRDGLPLGELATNPDVIAALGGPEAVAALPCSKPIEVCEVAAPRTAKTIRAVASALVATQTVDVSSLGPGEIPRVAIVSLTKDVADVPFGVLIGTVIASPVLRPLLLEHSKELAIFRHPSGKPIEVCNVAGARAGGSLIARWLAGAIFDEGTRMSGAEDGVVNLDDSRSAVLDRLLPGAQVQYIGSPWAPVGPVYEMVRDSWGKPSPELVVLRTTGPAGNPSHWTPEFCERLRRQDPNAYRVGVLGEFVDAVTGLMSPGAVQRNTRRAPLELPPEECGQCFAAIDPSEGGDGNGFSLVVVDRKAGRVRVVLAREWRNCGPEAALSEIAATCKRYGVRSCRTDQYAGAANAAIARRFGLKLEIAPSTGASNVENYTNLATLAASDEIEFSPDATLQRDLLSIRKRATSGGWRIELPRTGDRRHADLAAALAGAVANVTGTNAEQIARRSAALARLREQLEGDGSEVGRWIAKKKLGGLGFDPAEW